MKRRSFLQMVGLAPFAGPKAIEQAVKDTAATQAMRMAGVSVLGSRDGAFAMSPAPNEAEWAAEKLPDVMAHYAKLLAFGRDKMIAKVRRRHGRGTYTLDADLVANRSFSLATKIRAQRERDIERRADEQFKECEIDIAELKEILGLA